VAWAIAHTSSRYLAAPYHRFARRCGKHKAIVAVGHSRLVIISHRLASRSASTDLGPGYVDSLENERLQRHSVRCLERLGFAVTLTSPQIA
jgi:transposase